MGRDLWDSVNEGTGRDPLFDRETAGGQASEILVSRGSSSPRQL